MKGVCALSSAWVGYEKGSAVHGLDAESKSEAFGRAVLPVRRIVGLVQARDVTLVDEDDGRLSAKDLEHWKNLAIVGITLCSRAAIEGGLSPQSAYRISGYYIGKCSPQTSATQILGMRDYAIRDLAERVRERQKKQETGRRRSRSD